jgi:hypothetical protein
MVEQNNRFGPLMTGRGWLAYHYTILFVSLILQMQPLCKSAEIVCHLLFMM